MNLRNLAWRSVPRLGLAGVLIVAAWLRFSRLGNFDNQYYTAAVASMLQSWHNFLFASFDPGGVVMVDKPPVALWIDSIPAAVLGVSGFSVSLAHAVAGLAAVALLYVLVRTAYGRPAALLAALALAVVPAAVAMDTRNEPDSIVVFLLVLAAYCVVRAARGGRLWWLIAAAIVIGIGFNAKMWVALVPVPAFLAYYGLAAPGTWRLRLAHMALGLGVMAVVSVSWAGVVAATPPDRRPYVGSTRDNSIWTLVVEYNGLSRFGAFIGLRPPRPQPPGPGGGLSPAGGPPPPGQPSPPGGRLAPGGPPAPPSVWGMFTSPLGNQLGGLLLPAVLGLGVAAVRWLPRGVFRRPGLWLSVVRTPRGSQLLLWGGWLGTSVLVFGLAASTATHPYYLSELGPPTAAVLAIGLDSAWRRYRHRARLRWALPLIVGTGGAYQLYLLRELVSRWQQAGVMLLVAFSVGLLALALWQRAARTALARGAAVAGCLALLVAPLAASSGQVGPFVGARPPQSPPVGYGALPQGAPPAGPNVPRTVELVSGFISAQGDAGTVFALGAVRVSEAAPFIVRGIPAVAIGGFSGSDPIFTPESFREMASSGKLRYFLMGGNPGQSPGPGSGPGPQAPILDTIRRTWQDVSREVGLPRGTLYRYAGR